MTASAATEKPNPHFSRLTVTHPRPHDATLSAFDLAVGNLFGSNVFNMTIFPAMNLAKPGTSIFASLDQAHVLSALIAMILLALGVASIVFRAKRRFALVEPGSVLMVIANVVGVITLYRTHAYHMMTARRVALTDKGLP